ncbi:hypothetical protein OUZ56_030420 [Daphnia magna]|uniref:Uncharacterized protein n=1 Tax=Daphnia magna TaxID=35525 RepID=A0ABQ9ZR83_9CRUS|nr:hypothetical protein OUZ56_030420 [Daphnia magna]
MVTFDKIGGAHQFHSMIYAVAATTPQSTEYGQRSPHFYEAPRSTLMVYPIQDPMSSAFIIAELHTLTHSHPLTIENDNLQRATKTKDSKYTYHSSRKKTGQCCSMVTRFQST